MNDHVKLEHAMEAQFGRDWYLKTAHPQTVTDYLHADTDARRASAVATMKRDAVNFAMGCIHAGLSAGLVKTP